jgi:hypothetical protein
VVFILTTLLPSINLIKRKAFSNKASVQDTSDNSTTESPRPRKLGMSTRLQATLIFFGQGVIGALMMLLYMTFNIWVLTTISFGLTLGYYLFESKHDGYVPKREDSDLSCCKDE